eukprot:CAMPEP_0113464698 /NCGR_PEP_ID=MMETSP0014_2-20120614/13338_1 /TAXON_ID=2857 /ORGANISM="Nitzschia sp." /LENGTH=321 /DNA_ID=CAMNT_0000356793 /DNA_START=198 /DNA_END=1163 /DNA_ORIENTATION=- /assembly_acc=CAM_ASM_000159
MTTTTTETETVTVEIEVDTDETEQQQQRPKKHHHFDKIQDIDGDDDGDVQLKEVFVTAEEKEDNTKWGWFAIFIATTVLSVVLDLLFGGILLPESHSLEATTVSTITHNNKFGSVEAFVVNQPPTRRVMNKIGQQQQQQQQQRPTPTALFLEDWVAEMIDDELYRQSHHKEFEEEWMKKNRRAVLSRIQTEGFDDIVFGDDAAYDNPGDETPTMNDIDVMVELQHSKEDFRQHAKDVLLASKSPEQYCADRCVATGHCDVYEDMYEMSPQQVIEFCTECVLSEDEDAECDLPAAFFNNVDDDDDDDDAKEGGAGSAKNLSP